MPAEPSIFAPLGAKSETGTEKWKTGLCTCSCESMQSTCFALCCPICAYSEEYTLVSGLTGYPNCLCCGARDEITAQDSTHLVGCASYFNCFAWLMFLENPCCLQCCLVGAYRNKSHIEGNACLDCWNNWCCFCCAHAQLMQDAKDRFGPTGAAFDAPVLQNRL